MADLGERLTAKAGPLPVWGWAVLAVGGYFLYQHFKGSSASTSTSGTPASASTDTGAVSGTSGQGNAADNVNSNLLAALLQESQSAQDALTQALYATYAGGSGSSSSQAAATTAPSTTTTSTTTNNYYYSTDTSGSTAAGQNSPPPPPPPPPGGGGGGGGGTVPVPLSFSAAKAAGNVALSSPSQVQAISSGGKVYVPRTGRPAAV